MRTASERVFVAAIAFLMSAAGARADCVGFSLCSMFEYSQAAFLAHVVEVRAAIPNVPGEPALDVTFDVIEGFKNVRPGRRTFRIAQSSESPRFTRGERRLVYLQRGRNGLWSGGCSSRLVTTDDFEIATLRHFARGDAGATVSGGMTPADANWYRRPPDARITLRPVSGQGPTLSTTTHGWSFQFEWVPPGLYVVTLQDDESKRQQQLIRIGHAQRCANTPAFMVRER